MRLDAMRTQLRQRIGSPTATDVTDATLTDHLNSAYLDIADRYRFHKARKRCQFRTVQGEPRYDMPSDLLAIYRISDTTNNVKLEKWGDRQLSSRTDTTTQGKPLRYVRYRDWVELDPLPDYGNGLAFDDPLVTGYLMEVFYKYAIAAMVGDADVPGIPSSWHEGIVRMAKYYYYENIADAPKAAMAYEAFKLWVSDKPTEIDEESVDIDSGVEVLSLSRRVSPRLDFDHAD